MHAPRGHPQVLDLAFWYRSDVRKDDFEAKNRDLAPESIFRILAVTNVAMAMLLYDVTHLREAANQIVIYHDVCDDVSS